MSPTAKKWKRIIIASIILGAIAGISFLYLGILHETQSEFHLESGDFDALYALKVFATWFILIAIVCVVVLASLVAAFQSKKK